MITIALLGAAVLAAWETRRSWRLDRALNGRARRGGAARLRALVLLGRMVQRAGIAVPPPPFDRARLAERAGLGTALAAGDIDLARAGSTAVFAMVGAASFVAVGPSIAIIVAPACVLFGWLYPDLWLRAAAAQRGRQIERAAPLAIDLIAAAVDAGIPIDQAVEAAAAASSGPLRSELESVSQGLRLGNRRVAELRDLGSRTASPALAGLASALRISDRLGVPLAAGLRRQSARSRAAQAREVQERAAKAAPRVLLVVVFVLVPAAMLPVMTALALTAAGSVGSFLSP
jgi:tight adherence protein C